MASGSCRNFKNIRKLRYSLSVFKSVCHDSQSQRLHASKRLIACLTVTQRSRELRNLCNPASIIFLLQLNSHDCASVGASLPNVESHEELAELNA
jgi:hypothetical protein